jgi:hypothetical protein
VEARDVSKVAGHPVESLGDHHVEGPAAGTEQQLLVARAEDRRAADRGVLVDLDELPPLSLDRRAAEPDLVLDRGRALELGAVAGINDGPEAGLLVV